MRLQWEEILGHDLEEGGKGSRVVFTLRFWIIEMIIEGHSTCLLDTMYEGEF